MVSRDKALQALHYAYPIVIFSYYSISSILGLVAVQRRHGQSKKVDLPVFAHRAALSCLVLLLVTYFAQVTSVIIQLAQSHRWLENEHLVVSCLSCILVYGIQISQFSDDLARLWTSFYGSWLLALPFEVLITALGISQEGTPHLISAIFLPAIAYLRCGIVALLVGSPCLIPLFRKSSANNDEERQSLLAADALGQPSTSPTYGSTSQQEDDDSDTEEHRWERSVRLAKEAMEKRLQDEGGWFQYAMGFKILIPHVWPFGDRQLQLRAGAVMICLLGTNLLNLLIPRQTAIVIDSLLGVNAANPWLAVFIFVLLRLVSSDCGLSLFRQWLWMPVKYYSEESISRAAYSHMMNLSADFHDSKSSSEMVMAIHAGSSVSKVIETLLLQAAPMLLDMGVAIVYLSITFGPYEGFITVATGSCFVLLANRLIANAAGANRARNNAIYREFSVRFSGLEGWHTVSMFNQLGYEDNRHADAVADRWTKEKQFMIRWDLAVGLQSVVLLCGLSASAFLAVWRILQGRATSGQFTMLLMYWSQLSAPLKFFASLGKTLNDDLVGAERILSIMKKTPTVENRKCARPLKYVTGQVELDGVEFSYDGERSVIKHASLVVPGGQTVAFVGSTGAGKSTLLKLLNRFYDVTKGTIRIDGQDIRDIDLFSLRDRVGVVPQNPFMFDDTIINNVRYSNINASDEEVYKACEAACIHDKILGFTHGYNTRVGEQGTKLSGGEIQRLAIARAILKKPDIVLLDEATSAVDTNTEQQIQASFRRLCDGRTTFIIAHRLSTVMNADRIVVVDDGKFVEQGTHESLLAAKGKYADLWSKQTFLKPKKTQKEQCNGDTTLAPGEADHKSHLESVENPTENGTQAARQQQAEHSTGQESIELTRFLNS